MNESQFIRGFNCGYVLARFEPQLLISVLDNIQSNTSFVNGIKLGQVEYQQELFKGRIQEINQLNEKNVKRDINRE